MRTHVVIPDTQIKPGVPMEHLGWIGQYIVDKQPDVVVHIGDHADMPSLSSYDRGKRDFEGRRVKEDLAAAHRGMRILTKPIEDFNARKRKLKEKQYKPRMVITLGNHEERIARAINDDAKLDGILLLDDLEYEKYGWEVVEFTKPIEIDGVHYAHYFYNPKTGRPFGGESIDTRIKNIGFTFTMGHQQGYKSGIRELNNGKIIRGLIAGSCYLHDEDYIGPQGNGHWRGIIWKNEVQDGRYDLMEISLDYLCRRYEGVPVHKFMKKNYREIFDNSPWLQRMAQRMK
jgi:hypothetical protein